MSETKKPMVMLAEHTKKIQDRDRARMLDASLPQMHRVACPHEPIGAAVVEVHRKAGEAQLPVGQVVQCPTCRRHFEIAARVSLYGKPITT